MASYTASAVSDATASGVIDRRVQPDTADAIASMSDSSGASYCLW